jgi:hypothetical protein
MRTTAYETSSRQKGFIFEYELRFGGSCREITGKAQEFDGIYFRVPPSSFVAELSPQRYFVLETRIIFSDPFALGLKPFKG